MKKIIGMIALWAVIAACSKVENEIQPVVDSEGITITATLSPKSAVTKAVADNGDGKITASWAVGEHIAILYESSDTKCVAPAEITKVDDTTGAATIEFKVDMGTTDNTPCTLVYPLSAKNEENTGLDDVATLLSGQVGTLNPNLDVRVGEGTIHVTTPSLDVTTQPAPQFAIFKFTTKNSDATAEISVTPFTVTVDGQDYVITPASATSEFYVALPPVTEKTVSFLGIDGKNRYTANFTNISFAAGYFYQSELKLEKTAITIDLSKINGDITALDGDTMTGTLGGNYKISIADGATVTLDGVMIQGVNDEKYKWPGISCLGDATIILEKYNGVNGFYQGYPGIFVPGNKTLTIRGTGELKVFSNGLAAGIGGGHGHPYREDMDPCGNIIIDGGSINAIGTFDCPGIGGGGYGSTCGDITITAAVTEVYAQRGEKDNIVEHIGRGDPENDECGKVTIGGIIYWDGEKYLNGGEEYLKAGDYLLYKPAEAPDYSKLTAADKGKFLGANGYIYSSASEASSAGTVARAVIAYVGKVDNYFNHFLAIALEDALTDSAPVWEDALKATEAYAASNAIVIGHETFDSNSTGSTYYDKVADNSSISSATATELKQGWRLPSVTDWRYVFAGIGGLTDRTPTNPSGVEDQITYGTASGLRDAINTSCGNNSLLSHYYYYWSSSEYSDNSGQAWFDVFNAGGDNQNRISRGLKSNNACVRPVFAY